MPSYDWLTDRALAADRRRGARLPVIRARIDAMEETKIGHRAAKAIKLAEIK